MSKHPGGPKKRRAAWSSIFALVLCATSLGQQNDSSLVITYEGDRYPEQVGWERVPVGADEGDRTLEAGWFVQTLQEHHQDSYRRWVGHLGGLGSFFVEWRAVTDNPEWLIDEWQVPTVVSAAGNGAFYHVVKTESAAALTHFDLTRTIVAIAAGEPHTYRIEVFSDEYLWYLDGVVVDSGTPAGPYPDPNAFIIWGAEVVHDEAPPAVTAWDYVRAGLIAPDGGGDYDYDFDVDAADYYYVHDCLTKEGPGIFGGPDQDAGPGCRALDFDFDADVDLQDFSAFQNMFSEPECLCCDPWCFECCP